MLVANDDVLRNAFSGCKVVPEGQTPASGMPRWDGEGGPALASESSLPNFFAAAILREGKDYDQALYGSQGPQLVATNFEKPDTPPQ